jgi:hypothetical protein
MPGRSDYERAHAALRAGVDSVSKPKDELDAAGKWLTRRRRPAETNPLEQRLEFGATMLGLTRGETREIRQALGWEDS